MLLENISSVQARANPGQNKYERNMLMKVLLFWGAAFFPNSNIMVKSVI